VSRTKVVRGTYHRNYDGHMAHTSETAPRAAAQMNEDDLGIVDALAQLTFLIQSMLARRAAASDVSMIQMRLLGALRDRQPGMNDLAQLLGLDKSSITGLVDRAERRGLVKRTVSTEDRRVFRVSLTKSGTNLAERVAKEFQNDVATIVGDLSVREQTILSRLASRVVAAST
jgi:MarR family transcriptional regulator, lower aerobic nicotinate degradation pathway regulator